MGWQIDPNKTYEREIVDPDSPDPEKPNTATIVLRKLNHGDLERRRQEGIKMRRKARTKGRKASQEQLEYDAKAVSDWTYMRGIVSWTLPFPKTVEEFTKLDPEVSRQIKRYFREINPSIAAELADAQDEEDEEFEDDGDEIPELETDEDGEPVEAEPVFDEETGPTPPAVVS